MSAGAAGDRTPCVARRVLTHTRRKHDSSEPPDQRPHRRSKRKRPTNARRAVGAVSTGTPPVWVGVAATPGLWGGLCRPFRPSQPDRRAKPLDKRWANRHLEFEPAPRASHSRREQDG